MCADPSPASGDHVVLLGATRNTDNYGVRVLLNGAIEAISVLEPEARIVLLDYGKTSARWTERTSRGEESVELLNLRFSWRIWLPNNVGLLLILAAVWRALPFSRATLQRGNPWLDQVVGAKAAYSLAGGDSFSNIYGLERFAYVVLPQFLVLLLRRRLIQLPQTYGPFKGLLCRLLARSILSRSERIYSRDRQGVDTVAGLLSGEASVRVHVVPDLGFCMRGAPVAAGVEKAVADWRARGPLVGLNISRLLYMGGYDGKNMFGLRESFPALVDCVVEHLVRDLDVQVLLVPHVCGGPLSEEDETRLCERLCATYDARWPGQVHYVRDILDPQQIKTLIGQCDLFIGARMHACIGSASQHVPTVCLAYSSKFEGVMQALSPGVRVVDLRQATSEDAVAVIHEVYQARRDLGRMLGDVVPSLRVRAQRLEGA